MALIHRILGRFLCSQQFVSEVGGAFRRFESPPGRLCRLHVEATRWRDGPETGFRSSKGTSGESGLQKAHSAERPASHRSAIDCTALPWESLAPHFSESGVPLPSSTRLVWREENGTLASRQQAFHHKPCPEILEHDSRWHSSLRSRIWSETFFDRRTHFSRLNHAPKGNASGGNLRDSKRWRQANYLATFTLVRNR
jgi:hypothetical protein